METSILSSLGAGSGIDSAKLVGDLVGAARSPRQKSIDARDVSNSARLTTIGQLSSGISTFADGARTRLRTLADADIPSFVEDLVAAFNDLRGQLSAASQPGAALAGDAGARSFARALSALTGTPVDGTSLRLVDLGISTARDGTLVLDATKLAARITADLPGVRSLLGVGSLAPTGIAAALQTLKVAMTGSQGALAQSRTIYNRAAATITRDRERLQSDMTTLTDRLTRSFSAMDRQVAVIKASQAYLTQQVAIWTSR